MIDFNPFKKLIDEYDDNQDLFDALEKVESQYFKEKAANSNSGNQKIIRCHATKHVTPQWQIEESAKRGFKINKLEIITATDYAVCNNATLIIDEGIEL